MNPRSYLFVPGDDTGKLAKAADRGADALILDLEDAVAPANKESARTVVTEWLDERADTPSATWVRINPGVEGGRDVEAIRGSDIQGVMIPKAGSAHEVATWSSRVAGMNREWSILVLIETAGAVLQIGDIASIPGVSRLMIGEADLGAEVGMAPGHPAWDVLRTNVVVASAAAGITPPIGPVNPDFSSPDQLESETRHLAGMGFGARAIIHPAQIDPVHRALTPSDEEVDKARRLLKRHEEALASGEGAYRGTGDELVDEAFVRRARRILDMVRDEA